VPGTYYDKKAKSCKVCPRGTFQQSEGESSCNKCPKGQTTRNKGTRDRNSCEGKCKLEYIKTTVETFSYDIDFMRKS
jgi:hypothetical protein